MAVRTLDVGAGPASKAEVQVDVVKFPNTTHVFDAMMEPWPFEDESFDEVRMEQFLEHCPPIVKAQEIVLEVGEKPRWHTYYPIIHVMREAHRVLKHGGVLHCSVPSTPETHSQDPTHVGPMWTEGRFNYFCGQWGGNEPGSFCYESYGIDFAFKKLEAFYTGFILTERLYKE